MKTLIAKHPMLTPRKIGALLFTGFLIGAIFVSLGWAAPASKTKKQALKKKPAIQRVAKKKPAPHILVNRRRVHKKMTVARAVKTPPQAAPFKEYTHPNGLYQMRRPAGWKLTAKKDAMIMRSSGRNGDRGIFGIMRRPEDHPNEEAITREFTALDKPHDLTQTSARVAGMRAIKVMGSSKDNPNDRMVEYYVQNFDGQQYYILMVAPRDEWPRYATTFNTMLNSLSFN